MICTPVGFVGLLIGAYALIMSGAILISPTWINKRFFFLLSISVLFICWSFRLPGRIGVYLFKQSGNRRFFLFVFCSLETLNRMWTWPRSLVIGAFETVFANIAIGRVISFCVLCVLFVRLLNPCHLSRRAIAFENTAIASTQTWANI